ncbi:MAG: hypothetical protein QW599_06295 [Nitrososphaerota archaeon]
MRKPAFIKNGVENCFFFEKHQFPIEVVNMNMEKAEEVFREEYRKAMKYLGRKYENMHPRKKIMIARKIARKKYLAFIEKHGIRDTSHDSIRLEDLV